ncbi:alpha/beta fold hydrolase [Solwaraspora sp. WMMD406]|uniref:alpha/beta fold hydrolase n=1 Tax=Solwaraspora sp. WMMD406 TaxID=3016095 RepID=UPI0024160133|nr:alpha/beta fold hydrolase [Solwaraspora sp. WMMD406]MDG4765698.1 alpha/beta fold hydrolase [Solwaraspora sp. WMMD406]
MVRANGLVMHVQQLPPAAGGTSAAGGTARPGPSAGTGAPPGTGTGVVDAAASDGTAEPSAPSVTAVPTAVLIHGIGSDNLASWYLSLAHPLTAAGFRVVMYDLRGHGRTERPPTGYRVDDLVDDLAALLDQLGVREPVHLLGNSLGGTIAFSFAARQPARVASIVAVEAAPPTADWLARVGRQLARAAAPATADDDTALVSQRGERGARYAAAVRQLLATTTAGRDLPASTALGPADLSAVGCPVLGVFGSDSAAIDLAPVVAELLPQTRLVVVPGHRHAVLVTARDQVRELVLPWLAQRVTSGDAPVATGSPALRR